MYSTKYKRLGLGLRLQRAVVARAAHALRDACRDHADKRDEIGDSLHHRLGPGLIARRFARNRPRACSTTASVGTGKGSPNNAATFRCTSMTAFTLVSSRCRRSVSRCSSTHSFASGCCCAVRSRCFGVRSASSPLWGWRRQSTRCGEYSPSRRSSSPIGPPYPTRALRPPPGRYEACTQL